MLTLSRSLASRLAGEPRPAIELARIALRAVPFLRRLDQMPVEPPALGVLVQPRAQPRPFAEQRLVRDLELVLPDREETPLAQDRDHAAGVLVRLEVELRERGAAARNGASLRP